MRSERLALHPASAPKNGVLAISTSISLALLQIQSLTGQEEVRAVSQGAGELNAQENAQRRDRVGYMALGATGFPEASNPGETAGTWRWAKFFYACLTAQRREINFLWQFFVRANDARRRLKAELGNEFTRRAI